MSHYEEISKHNFESFLKTISLGVIIDESDEQCYEFIYDLPFEHDFNLKIRIFSSIDKLTKTSRKVGSDAIRVCLWHCDTNKMILGAKRVNRTENWREGVSKRISFLTKSFQSLKCPNCNGYIVSKKGKYGYFSGCSNYSNKEINCKFTRN
jgi:hypothetical protein